MSSASGLPDENKALPGALFLTRRGWRITGVVSLVVSAVMAWWGVALIGEGWHWLVLLAWWGMVPVLLLVATYTVLLDLRFTHLHYVLAEREVFMETLGSEEFRREIRRIAATAPAAGKAGKEGGAPPETPAAGLGTP